jgi:hypothetical protein
MKKQFLFLISAIFIILLIVTPLVLSSKLHNQMYIHSLGLNSTLNSTFPVNYDKLKVFPNAITFWNITFINPASCGNASSYYAIFNKTTPNNQSFLPSICPGIILMSPINDSNLSTQTNNYTANITDDFEISNVTLNVQNMGGSTIINTTTILSSSIFGIVINTSATLNDGVYVWWYNAKDIVNNFFSIRKNTVTIDSTSPTITISSPMPQNYGTNSSLILGYNVTDNLIGLLNCSYYIYDTNNNLIIDSTDLPGCQNSTFSLPAGDMNYLVTIYADDLLNNTGSSSVLFGIRTNSPAVSLGIANYTNVNNGNNTIFNFSATTNANSIPSCSFWINQSGALAFNQTKFYGFSGVVQNFNKVNLSEGNYLWNVNCSDNFGTIGWGIFNETFVVDLTAPTFGNITLVSYPGTQTFSFNVSVNDSNLNTCKYSIYNTSGSLDGLNTNVSFNCKNGTSPTTTKYGNFNLSITAFDYAGNSNMTSTLFTLSPSGITPGGAGGGVTIVGIANWTMTPVKYEIYKVKGIPRTFGLTFENKGESLASISLRCENVKGDLCKYVTFENQTFNLQIVKKTLLYNSFTINFPENISTSEENFNIKARDNKINEVTTTVSATYPNFFLSLGLKLLSEKNILGLMIPFYLIFFILWILISFILDYFIKKIKKLKQHVVISSLFGLIISLTIIYFWK